MIRNIKHKLCPILLLFILIFASTYISIDFINATAISGFKDHSDNWANLDEDNPQAQIDLYPYNSDTATIKSVSLDILFGTSKKLIAYYGEVPYAQTRDEEGNVIDDYNGIYAEEGTTLEENTNPPQKTIHAKSYWGMELDDVNNSDGAISRNDLEKVNDESVVSLRLYALQTSAKENKFFELGNIFYSACQFFIGIATWILNTIVTLKNIDILTILKVLKLDTISEMVTKFFILDSESGVLSPFMAFALILLVFSIAVYSIKYAKGGTQSTSKTEMAFFALSGVIVIGMCLTGNLSTLNSSVATLANKACYLVSGSLSGTTSTFTTDITDTDKSNEGKIISIQEMNLIYKSYINFQICTQFGVSSINDLNFDKLGDSNGEIAKETLITNSVPTKDGKWVGTVDLKDNFDNNLGYYYWFANSAAIKKSDKNAEFVPYNTASAEKKLTSMITYLQKVYNADIKNNDTKKANKIVDMIQSLSNPSMGSSGGKLLLYFAILILLALCIWKYGVKAALYKVLLFISILGLAVAGPLMLTTNKKLADTGKRLVTTILASFIYITVYSIFFDVILYIISFLISPNLITLLIVLILIILFLKLQAYLDEFLARNVTNKVSNMSITRGMGNKLKMNAYNTLNNARNKYDNSEKIVDFDADGNPITEKRKGDKISTSLSLLTNSMANANNKKSVFKIGRENSEAVRQSNYETISNTTKAAERHAENIEDKVKEEAEQNYNDFKEKIENIVKDIIKTDEFGNISYDTSELTDEELENLKELNAKVAELKSIYISEEFKNTLEKIENANKNGTPVDPDVQAKADKDKEDINKLSQAIEKYRQNIDKSVKYRIELQVRNDNGLDVTTKEDALEFTNDLKDVTRLKSQNKHKVELRDALVDLALVTSKEANTKFKGKNADKMHMEAALSYTLAQQKIYDIDKGILRHDRLTEPQIKGVSDITHYKDINNTQTNQNRKIRNAQRAGNSSEFINANKEKNRSKQRGKDISKMANSSTTSDMLDTLIIEHTTTPTPTPTPTPQSTNRGRQTRSYQQDDLYTNQPIQSSGQTNDYQGNQQSGQPKPSGNQQNGQSKPIGNQQNGQPKPSDNQQNGQPKPSGNQQNGQQKPSGNQQNGQQKPSGNQQNGQSKPSGNQQNGQQKPSGNQQNGQSKPSGNQQNSQQNGQPSQQNSQQNGQPKQNNQQQDNKPQNNKPQNNQQDNKPQNNQNNKPQNNKPQDNKPQNNQQNNKPQNNQNNKPQNNKQQDNKPQNNQQNSKPQNNNTQNKPTQATKPTKNKPTKNKPTNPFKLELNNKNNTKDINKGINNELDSIMDNLKDSDIDEKSPSTYHKDLQINTTKNNNDTKKGN